MTTKPWYRKTSKAWYATIDGKQVRLADNEGDAWARLQEIERGEGNVNVLVDAFLQWCEIHRSPETHRQYRVVLDNYRDHKGSLVNWIDNYANTDSQRRNAVKVLRRLYSWGIKHKYCKDNPASSIEKPPESIREAANDDEYILLRESCSDALKKVVDFMWHTGCRAQEAKLARWEWYDPKRSRIVFPIKSSKGKKRQRVVYLPECAVPDDRKTKGPMFANSHGNPWKTSAIQQGIKAARDKSGATICLTQLRHAWVTKAIKRGVDTITVAELAGHTDTTMISRVYAHLRDDPTFLHNALTKISDNGEKELPSDKTDGGSLPRPAA